MSPENTEQSKPMTMDELLKAYAVTLQAYDDADHAFRVEPTALNVSTLHRWLDRLMSLRDQISRSTRLSDAVLGARAEPGRFTPPGTYWDGDVLKHLSDLRLGAD